MSKKTEEANYTVDLEVNWANKRFPVHLQFGSYASFIIQVHKGKGEGEEEKEGEWKAEVTYYSSSFVTAAVKSCIVG